MLRVQSLNKMSIIGRAKSKSEETSKSKKCEIENQDDAHYYFRMKGIIHREFVPRGKMVNGKFYEGVMRRLIRRIHSVRPTLIESGNWFLLHDNALVHTLLRIRLFLSKNKVVSLDHPQYSPDLTVADYFLFSKLEITRKGKRFQSIPSIQREVTR